MLQENEHGFTASVILQSEKCVDDAVYFRRLVPQNFRAERETRFEIEEFAAEGNSGARQCTITSRRNFAERRRRNGCLLSAAEFDATHTANGPSCHRNVETAIPQKISATSVVR